jgi:transposase
VLWVARTGAPWRDLPDEFGKWYTVYTRFWRWAKKGVWERILKHLSQLQNSPVTIGIAAVYVSQ